ncbi:MAG TPA: hypothetical protein VHA75_20220 [Rugosimonospora sp.]|nr:hypothetical protein [Rugosimonospora sp.]
MIHPNWCARGHRCGLGEHRSEPATIHGLVATRVSAGTGEWVEFRGSMRLTTDDQAVQLLAALDLAVRAVLSVWSEELISLIEVAGTR